jgi:hypothetical protein
VLHQADDCVGYAVKTTRGSVSSFLGFISSCRHVEVRGAVSDSGGAFEVLRDRK